MPVPRVFIDGSSGTTGLRIRDWLTPRRDITVLSLDNDRRRDADARRAMFEEADLAVLCLPDEAAEEAAAWALERSASVIDASTAHRVADGWTYGLPEMDPDQRDAIREETRVSNPGCYATGVILLLRPLIQEGLVPADAPITVHALSGYSGGGKKMIAEWEAPESELGSLPFESPYALESTHKHIPEMTRYSGLEHEPQFIPAVGPFSTGMRIEIPLHRSIIESGGGAVVGAEAISHALSQRYAGERFVRVLDLAEASGAGHPAFDPRAANDTNRIDLAVIPNELGHVLLMAQLDNLGKGASGAAIQNMNLMLGLRENAGLLA